MIFGNNVGEAPADYKHGAFLMKGIKELEVCHKMLKEHRSSRSS